MRYLATTQIYNPSSLILGGNLEFINEISS